MSTQNRIRLFGNVSLAIASVGLAVLIASPADAAIATYDYTTTVGDSGPGAGIDYSLTVNDLKKAFTYVISTTNLDLGTDEWWANWFNIKLNPGSPGFPLSLTTTPPGTVWATAISLSAATNAKVLKGGGGFGNVAQDGFSSIYNTQIDNVGTVDITTGLLLTGGPATYTFTGTFNGAFDALTTESIPFQVGYYDGVTGGHHGNVIVNQLSRELEPVMIPEGSSLAILGGLLGATGVFLRRRKLTEAA